MTKVLLVEDERNFAQVLKDYLQMNDFEVTLSANGEEGIEAFKKDQFDLCVIDIMMPKKDGFTLSSEIRAINKRVPIIFLTARSMREDMVKGYKLGADDYLTKPFDSELLLLKLKAILQRRENNQIATENNLFELGMFSFNAKLRTLKSIKMGAQKLSPKESALLQLLCQYQNDVLKREIALKLIWKEETYFTGRSMDVYMVKLRKYLAADPNVEITNLHGDGYMLTIKKN